MWVGGRVGWAEGMGGQGWVGVQYDDVAQGTFHAWAESTGALGWADRVRLASAVEGDSNLTSS